MVGGLVRPLVDGDVVFFLSLGSLESSTVGEVCFRESLQERSDSLLNVSRELPRGEVGGLKEPLGCRQSLERSLSPLPILIR
jgi:hypothetical protein